MLTESSQKGEGKNDRATRNNEPTETRTRKTAWKCSSDNGQQHQPHDKRPNDSKSVDDGFAPRLLYALFSSLTPLRFIRDSMILRRCLRLTMLACSVYLVIGEEPKLRGTIIPERKLDEEGLARNSLPPMKKKRTKKKKKTAAPITVTEPATTSSPVNDEDKSEQVNWPEEEAAPEDEYHPMNKPKLDELANESQVSKEQHDESQEPDESLQDEQQPYESQGPDESEEGATQQDVPQEDEKHSEESVTPTDATTDPCVSATTCLECEKAASNSTLNEQTCVWKDSSCKQVSKGEAPTETKCDEHESAANNATTAKDTVPAEEDEEGSSVSQLVTIMVVLGVLVALRTYLKNHDVVIPGSGGGIPGALRSSRHAETVPLAGGEDDEWGWGDSGGDVELPTSRTQQQDDEDLRLAMALSLSESPTPPPASKSGMGMAPFPTRRMNSGVRNTSSSSAEWDDWDGENQSVGQTPVSSPRTSALPPPTMPKAASLGARPTVPKRMKDEKPKEDDIFVTIGLAAKPTFSSRTNAPSSGGYTGGAKTTAPAPAPVTSALSAAAADVGEGVGEDWGDDSDLDDLLDE